MPKDKADKKASHEETSDGADVAELRATSAPDLPKDLAKQLQEETPESAEKKLKKPAKEDTRAQEAVRAHGQPDAVSDTADEKVDEPQLLKNTETDKAVDDIVSEESDELLAVEDAMVDDAKVDADAKQSGKLRRFFWAWWHNSWARWATFAAIVALAGAVMAVPASRYFVLNNAGVRSSASVEVLDATTQLPLKNVSVSLGQQKLRTNINGIVKFEHLKLGTYQLDIRRVAFAAHDESVTIGWGSNPLGAFPIKAVGRQYTIQLSDYLSDKPVLAGEVVDGDISALSDKNGKAVLTLDSSDLSDETVTIQAGGYRSETLVLHADSTAVPKVVLVPSQKEVFISKQSGKYDVYAMDIDGKNKKLLLAGTGRENSNLSLAVNADGSEAALVSTRDNMQDKDGYLLSALTLINVNDGTILSLDHADQIQLIDWIGNRIVYQAAAAGASASNPQRYRLIGYDFKANSRSQLASANQFNAVMSANDFIYYANSSTEPKAQVGFFKVKPDGTGRQEVLSEEVWSGFRISATGLMLQTPGGWYSYSLKTDSAAKIAAPSSYANRLYISNASGGKEAWVDSRDGKGTLLVYDNGSSKDIIAQTQEGLAYPVRWLNEHTLLYRIASGQETADYAVSIDGGHAKKVTDVTNSYGFAQAY